MLVLPLALALALPGATHLTPSARAASEPFGILTSRLSLGGALEGDSWEGSWSLRETIAGAVSALCADAALFETGLTVAAQYQSGDLGGAFTSRGALTLAAFSGGALILAPFSVALIERAVSSARNPAGGVSSAILYGLAAEGLGLLTVALVGALVGWAAALLLLPLHAVFLPLAVSYGLHSTHRSETAPSQPIGVTRDLYWPVS